MSEMHYHYKECGLDGVYLVNGFAIRDTERGQTVRIQDIEGLHRAIGRLLLESRKRLSGKEFRFLRHELGMSQATLAVMLGVDEQSVARWEKGRSKIPSSSEANLRLLYEESIGDNVSVRGTLQRIADLEDVLDRTMELMETDDGWSEAA